MAVAAGKIDVERAGEICEIDAGAPIAALAFRAAIDYAIHFGDGVYHFLGDIVSLILIRRAPFIFRAAPIEAGIAGIDFDADGSAHRLFYHIGSFGYGMAYG